MTTTDMKICAVVPSYNHYRKLDRVIGELRRLDIPVLIVDDGSCHEAAQAIALLHDPDNAIHVHRLDTNHGKGYAVMHGLRRAADHGYTHALQVDADGQHDLKRLPELLELARQYPDDLISGRPVFDNSMPAARRIGRWLTHVLVWCESLSLTIRDSMCGFRCYPVAACLALQQQERLGRHMDFDTEIMVRLYWRGMKIRTLPVDVVYPAGNISNFRMWRDNRLMSVMHLRLLAGMLYRLPRWLRQGGWQKQQPETKHWAAIEERGTAWAMTLLIRVYQYGGRRACLAAILPGIIYFYLSGRDQRRASLNYLRRIAALKNEPGPGMRRSLQHFFSFAQAAVDKVAAWCGELNADMINLPSNSRTLFDHITREQPALLLVSHFGNIECIRAIASRDRGFMVNVLIHRGNSPQFSRTLRQLAPDSEVNLIEVADIGPETALLLKQKVEAGEWVVIAADRVAIGAGDRTVTVDFLGSPAAFPQGPIILAHVLQCPVYMAAAWREGDRFQVTWRQLATRIELPRQQRQAAIREYVAAYAAWLQPLVLQQPLQWFNFYDFWSDEQTTPPPGN